jgi:hypothetical protein
VKQHSVFPRKGCVLPSRLDPLQEAVSENWTQVEELASPVFDTMIRQAGWNFIWTRKSCARKGFAISRQDAIDHALIHALNGVALRFNAAELDSVHVAKHLGLHFAAVTVQSRQTQQHTSPDSPNAL